MTPAITMMGCRIDKLSMEETLGRIEEFIRSGKPHQHVVVNVDKLVKASRETCRRPCAQLVLAGWRDGYWQGEAEEALVAKQVRASGADPLFVAIGSPKKEQFLGRWQAMMRIPFAMGVGGSFDVASGRVKRAPRWMRRADLEWFYRFLQEPRRMFRRYFIEDMPFFWLLIKEAAHMRRQ
jgi:N-acetylglucosaminyldiphosphoundecaprenol N-acetyl-beta-D-mannosaminyltransferase